MGECSEHFKQKTMWTEKRQWHGIFRAPYKPCLEKAGENNLGVGTTHFEAAKAERWLEILTADLRAVFISLLSLFVFM